jgi:ribulose-phosphate 3-epimerase
MHRTIGCIRTRGLKAGAVVNPSTPIGALEEIASDVDFVLVMSVNPGFGGQQFIPHSLDKRRRLRELLTATRSAAEIEADGGIDESNVVSVVAAGATIVVAGSAIFGAPDPEAATRALPAAANGGVAAGRRAAPVRQ